MSTVLRVQELTKVIKGITILDKVNMEVDKGQVYGFLGPNGSGKTTSLRIILGMMPYTSGRVELFGVTSIYGNFKLHNRVAVLSENNIVLRDESAFDYLDFFGNIYKVPDKTNQIENLLEKLNLLDYKDLPAFYFSKGMKQKLGLARVLLADPELIILDEPTTGLDSLGMVQFRNIIEEEKAKGKTVIISSHILSEIEKIADSIGIIQKGKIIFEGSPEEVALTVKPLSSLTIELTEEIHGLQELLETVEGIEEIDLKGKTIIIRFLPDYDIRPLISQKISDMNGTIVEMHSQKASLEENFLELTKENVERFKK